MSALHTALLAAFGAAVLAVLAAASGRRALRDRARAAGRARPSAPAAPLAARPRLARALAPLAAFVEPLLSSRAHRRLDAALHAAGLDEAWRPADVVALQLSSAAAAIALVRGLLDAAPQAGAASAAGATGGASWTLAALVGLVGAGVPLLRLRDRARARRRQAGRQFPALLDLLTLALEAGQGVSSALALAVDRLPAGALRDELDRAQVEIRAGRPRADALRAMADRLASPGAVQLAATLAAGERQGASLGGLLRVQAAQLRQERFVRAERAALQAPVKLLAPLALCVFPGTFAVLFVPVAVRLLAEGVL